MSVEHRILVAFAGHELIARGGPVEVVLAAKRLQERQRDCDARIAIIDDRTGGPIDVDYSGDEAEVAQRLREQLGLHRAPAGVTAGETDAAPARRGPGRPRLGVVSREVSLLPRHWEWLSKQRGGASASLRRLVEAARKQHAADDERRHAVEVVHRFMWDMAGNLPGFEEASRALFAHDFAAFEARIADFPVGLQVQLMRFVDRARPPSEVPA